jgi:hypothetical protein
MNESFTKVEDVNERSIKVRGERLGFCGIGYCDCVAELLGSVLTVD